MTEFATWMETLPESVQGLVANKLPELGEERCSPEIELRLDALSPSSLFAEGAVNNEDAALCCMSAIWLLQGGLGQSHEISQHIPSREGSFWHGIMHRREGDFSNAKYWFRQVGNHHTFATIVTRVRKVVEAEQEPATAKLAEKLTRDWQPGLFVDLCQQAMQKNDSNLTRLCRQIALAEWEVLFAYCHDLAQGDEK